MTETRLVVCMGPTCGARGSNEVRRALVQLVNEAPGVIRARVLTSGCRGQCDDAVVVARFPDRARFAQVSPEGVARVLAAPARPGRGVASARAAATARPTWATWRRRWR